MMPRFAAPLSTRRLRAEAKGMRYRTDPEWRLKRINRAREAQGLPPRASLNEVKMRVPMESIR
jgi:hypothetical protein